MNQVLATKVWVIGVDRDQDADGKYKTKRRQRRQLPR